MDLHALRFGAAQGKTGIAHLHQQRIGAYRPARDDAHWFASDKTELAQALGDRIVSHGVDYLVDHCGSKGKQF